MDLMKEKIKKKWKREARESSPTFES